MHLTKGRKFLWGLKWMVMGAAFLSLVSLAVMGLWNWLLPGLVGVPAIGFLQAAGLLLLSRLLLGGFKKGGWHGRQMHWKHRMAAKWEQMTPEERDQWKSQMKSWNHHCCGHSQSASTPKA